MLHVMTTFENPSTINSPRSLRHYPVLFPTSLHHRIHWKRNDQPRQPRSHIHPESDSSELRVEMPILVPQSSFSLMSLQGRKTRMRFQPSVCQNHLSVHHQRWLFEKPKYLLMIFLMHSCQCFCLSFFCKCGYHATSWFWIKVTWGGK